MSEYLIKSGTIGGTLTIILNNISSQDILKTAVLAAAGACVSFGLSLVLRKLMMKKKKNRKRH